MIIGLRINMALRDIVSLKATQFTESGTFSNIFKNVYWDENMSKPEPIGPQVLTMRHLGPGFVIITVLLGFCVLAFVLECIPSESKKLFRAFLSCYIVLKFTRMNRVL
jgi:hypothetical protein